MVIQRWQSLLLLISTVMMCIFACCSLGQIQGATVTADIYSYGVFAESTDTLITGTIYVTAVALLSAVCSLLAIFFFKNHRLQKRLCVLAILFCLAACGSEWLALREIHIPGSTSIGYSSLAFAPFIAVASTLSALRCIRSDEKKLKAADRLR